MSSLENEARPLLLPLIQGTPVALTAPEQLVVATWAVKTAMVFDLTRVTAYFSQQERDYLYQARAQGRLGPPFPPHTFVWLATCENDKIGLSATASELSGVGRGGDGQEMTVQGHVATISAGAFVTQVLIVRRPPEEPIHEPDPTGLWDRATVRIWPLGGTQVHLPPEVLLNDQTLFDYALRWPLVSSEARPVASPSA